MCTGIRGAMNAEIRQKGKDVLMSLFHQCINTSLKGAHTVKSFLKALLMSTCPHL